jgi:hypothetical protein
MQIRAGIASKFWEHRWFMCSHHGWIVLIALIQVMLIVLVRAGKTMHRCIYTIESWAMARWSAVGIAIGPFRSTWRLYDERWLMIVGAADGLNFEQCLSTSGRLLYRLCRWPLLTGASIASRVWELGMMLCCSVMVWHSSDFGSTFLLVIWSFWACFCIAFKSTYICRN